MPIATHHRLINYQPRRHGSDRPTLAGRVATLTGSALGTLGLWLSRFRRRRAFPVLDDRQLRDFGVTRWELERELAKPFWRD
jgi:uncharacterized protein YjiS (DUF1127 family)